MYNLPTMYIKNKRDSSKIKGYVPFQLHRKLKVYNSLIVYISDTKRCAHLAKADLHNDSSVSLFLLFKLELYYLRFF